MTNQRVGLEKGVIELCARGGAGGWEGGRFYQTLYESAGANESMYNRHLEPLSNNKHVQSCLA